MTYQLLEISKEKKIFSYCRIEQLEDDGGWIDGEPEQVHLHPVRHSSTILLKANLKKNEIFCYFGAAGGCRCAVAADVPDVVATVVVVGDVEASRLLLMTM